MSIFSFLLEPIETAAPAPPAEPYGELITNPSREERPGEYPQAALDDIPADTIPRPRSYRLTFPQALPVVPGLGKIIATRKATIAAGTRLPVRLGLSDFPSGVQIAYMMIYVTGGTAEISGDESALAGGRFEIPAGVGLSLDHVAMLWAWGNAVTEITISVLVVGTY